MTHVPELRRCCANVGRLVFFGRMLDKHPLHAADKLPAEYQKNLDDARLLVLDGRSVVPGRRPPVVARRPGVLSSASPSAKIIPCPGRSGHSENGAMG